ncbi:MAG: hypothetical protein CMJ49_09400 [Planctomycetaceae bacterium]|nr:hypothetical protein [Planctomycetaceae bacterium]
MSHLARLKPSAMPEWALYAAVVVVLILTIARLASMVSVHDEFDDVHTRLVALDPPPPEEPVDDEAGEDGKEKKDEKPTEKKFEPDPAVARIGKTTAFVVKPKPSFSATLQGILGDDAYISGKAVKVGGSVAGGTLKVIGPDYVEIEWKGEKKTLYVFGKGGIKSVPGKPKEKPKKEEPKPAAPKVEPEAKAPEPATSTSRDDIELPEGWTWEMVEEARKEWKNMSAEEQKEALEEVPEEYKYLIPLLTE